MLKAFRSYWSRPIFGQRDYHLEPHTFQSSAYVCHFVDLTNQDLLLCFTSYVGPIYWYVFLSLNYLSFLSYHLSKVLRKWKWLKFNTNCLCIQGSYENYSRQFFWINYIWDRIMWISWRFALNVADFLFSYLDGQNRNSKE